MNNSKKNNNKKLKVLFIGWINIPHSYAIVNCFQLLHLHKNYKDSLEIYVSEYEYYNPEWNQSKKLIYGDEKNETISHFKNWNGEMVDLVYSITYPYDIWPINLNGVEIPKCVFYTSEFSKLTLDFFKKNEKMSSNFNTEQKLIHYIQTQTQNENKLYFTSPSKWSSEGLRKWGINDSRNRIITHGIDHTIFYRHKSDIIRNKIREKYQIKNDDILMINIGAMTQNKGIELILEALNILVNKQGLTHYKLLLKGTSDLYSSQQFLEKYFEMLQYKNKIKRDELEILLSNHIIFTNKTMSYQMINDFYNASDVYLSPYLAEGFNLTVLEALSSGLPVVVPMTGSTREYIHDIYYNGGKNFINFVQSQVGVSENGLMQNIIHVDFLVRILKNLNKQRTEIDYLTLENYIIENYSWDTVSHKIFSYFSEIVENSKMKN